LNAVFCLLLCAGAGAHAGKHHEWQFSGDARGGVYASERRARDGERSREEELRLRLRLAAERPLSANWSVRGRLAGTFASEQSGLRFYLRDSSRSRGGLAAGEATIDELQLHYRASSGNWWLTAGRFQSRFLLPGPAGCSPPTIATTIGSPSFATSDASTRRCHWRRACACARSWRCPRARAAARIGTSTCGCRPGSDQARKRSPALPAGQ